MTNGVKIGAADKDRWGKMQSQLHGNGTFVPVHSKAIIKIIQRVISNNPRFCTSIQIYIYICIKIIKLWLCK